jgi:uncharacterized membrane protein YoaK (UPF0700 family)
VTEDDRHRRVRDVLVVSLTLTSGAVDAATSTLAGLVTALAGRQRPEDWQRSTGTLLAIVGGALLGALTVTWFPDWLPVVILTPLAAVTAFSVRIAKRDQALDPR